MDGALRIGAWMALVLGIHAAPALSVPLWEAPARESATWVYIRVDQRPRFQTATEAVVDPVDCSPAYTREENVRRPAAPPPKVVKTSTVRCSCCKNGCVSVKRGVACACMLPGVYDGPDPFMQAQIRPYPKPYDPGCCDCTRWALTSDRPSWAR